MSAFLRARAHVRAMAASNLQGISKESVTPRSIYATDPAARENSAVVAVGKCWLFSHFIQVKSGGADLYLWFFDSASAIGTKPLFPPIKVSAGTAFAGKWPGIQFNNGLMIALSSDDETYAAPGAGVGRFYVEYVSGR